MEAVGRERAVAVRGEVGTLVCHPTAWEVGATPAGLLMALLMALLTGRWWASSLAWRMAQLTALPKA